MKIRGRISREQQRIIGRLLWANIVDSSSDAIRKGLDALAEKHPEVAKA